MDKDIEIMGDRIRNLIPKRSEISGEKKPSVSDTNKLAQTKLIETLEQSGIYKRYQNVTFENIEKRGLPKSQNICENYERVKQYAAEIGYQVQHGFGLVLAGHYGTMKTTMAVAILRSWLDTGHGGLIVPMCSLIDNFNMMRILNREEYAKYDRRIRNTPLLILDDLGGEELENRVQGKIDSVITERYNKMLPTIITTNMTMGELAGTYSGRVIDRLRNTSTVLIFDENSQRRDRWDDNKGDNT